MSGNERAAEVRGTIRLADGTTSEFNIIKDGGWQQWAAVDDRLRRTGRMVEVMAAALLDENMLTSDNDPDDDDDDDDEPEPAPAARTRRMRTRVVQSTGDPGKWQAQYADPNLDGLWCDIGDAQAAKADAESREADYRSRGAAPVSDPLLDLLNELQAPDNT